MRNQFPGDPTPQTINFIARLRGRLPTGAASKLDEALPQQLREAARAHAAAAVPDSTWISEVTPAAGGETAAMFALVQSATPSAVRRNLLVVSSVALFIGFTRTVPTKVSAVGLDLSGSSKAFELLLVGTLVYNAVHYLFTHANDRAKLTTTRAKASAALARHQQVVDQILWVRERASAVLTADDEREPMEKAAEVIAAVRGEVQRRRRAFVKADLATLTEYRLPMGAALLAVVAMGVLLVRGPVAQVEAPPVKVICECGKSKH